MSEDLNYIPRLQQQYNEVIQKELLSNLKLSNIFEVPKISKVVINIGAGSQSVSDSKKVNDAAAALELISGQKPVKTSAKKAIAGFKLREGMAVGVKVTLRKTQMYEKRNGPNGALAIAVALAVAAEDSFPARTH